MCTQIVKPNLKGVRGSHHSIPLCSTVKDISVGSHKLTVALQGANTYHVPLRGRHGASTLMLKFHEPPYEPMHNTDLKWVSLQTPILAELGSFMLWLKVLFLITLLVYIIQVLHLVDVKDETECYLHIQLSRRTLDFVRNP